jgi:ubiquinone/menaquinone biosynthesis C-methylase UbiE
MEHQIHHRVAQQFGPNAAAYASSAGHANAAVLEELVALVAPGPRDRLLDIATGAGHVALAFAPRVGQAVALDLTPAMLEQVRSLASERGLSNVSTVQGRAESLPFPDGSFEIVTARLAPHHFADVRAFVREVHRVLVPGGTFLLVDTTVPEDDELDAQINHLELLRDPSHVRNYRASEWRDFLEEAGLAIEHQHVGMHAGGTRMELSGWMDRIGTPPENRDELLRIFGNPSQALAEALEIRTDGSELTFSLPELTLKARSA